MKLGFEESQSSYSSGSQKCAHMDRGMGERVGVLPALRQREDFGLPKQQSAGRFLLYVLRRGIRAQEPEGKIRREGPGRRIQDQMRASRRQQQSQPLLMNYDLKSLAVVNLFIVPKHFFVREIIEERKPLAVTARRAGWIGSKILLDRVPESGKIHIVQNGLICAKE